jgi:hypothetical protein
LSVKYGIIWHQALKMNCQLGKKYQSATKKSQYSGILARFEKGQNKGGLDGREKSNG